MPRVPAHKIGVGVENPLSLELRCPILTRLAEHGVDQGRVAGVNVCYDCQISGYRRVASWSSYLSLAFPPGGQPLIGMGGKAIWEHPCTRPSRGPIYSILASNWQIGQVRLS